LAQTVGIEYTTAGKNAFITASNVVIVPFLYWLTSRKKPNIYEVIGAILCFVGIGVLSLDANLTMGLGDLLTLIGGFFYACHIVSVGYYSKKHDPILLTIFQFSVTAILSLIFALIFEPKVSSVTGEMIFPIVYLALFSTLIGFLIQNVAQKYTSSTHAAIILSMESVFGNIFSIIFLKEALSVRLFIGCLLILISVITTETKWSFLRKEIAEK
jgi:drug/metabolite transporter (DMT)-like permease